MKKFIFAVILALLVSCSPDPETVYEIQSIEFVSHNIIEGKYGPHQVYHREEHWNYIYHVTKRGYPFDIEMTLLKPNRFIPGDSVIILDRLNIKKYK